MSNPTFRDVRSPNSFVLQEGPPAALAAPIDADSHAPSPGARTDDAAAPAQAAPVEAASGAPDDVALSVDAEPVARPSAAGATAGGPSADGAAADGPAADPPVPGSPRDPQVIARARAAVAELASGKGDHPNLEGRGGRILIVDDDQSMCELVEASLRRLHHDVVSCTSAQDAIARASDEDFDVVVTDLNMGGMSGLELCERIAGMRPDVSVVVITGHGSMESAVAAIRAGAYDFITKPVDMKVLSLTVARALQQRRLRDEVKRLRQAVGEQKRFSQLVGGSAAIRRVHDLVARVAESDASVLVTGESGTGKELVARAIHERSSRATGPFVAINCAAMPAALLESELFGHTRGAFTDAKASRTGLFVQANGGTIFLDEIGELPLDMQPKLLRALQEKRVRPVGGNTEQSFDARIVTATNRDLETEVDEKRFREDLYYRVNVVKIEVPPLRERGNDILVLAQHFVERFSGKRAGQVRGISAPAAEKLMNYEWPGNVRELENCVERAIALTRFDQITVEDLPEKIRDYRANRLVVSADDATELVSMDELERRYILRVMSLVGGNKSRAAEILGFDRRTLYRKLERYERARS